MKENKYNYVYVLTQLKVRELLEKFPEEFVKYAYDNYTYKMGMKPIRKRKTRQKVKEDFKNLDIKEKLIEQEVIKLIKYTETMN